MTFFGKTLEELVAFCANNEYIEQCPGLYILYNETGVVCSGFSTDADWASAMAAINGNRTLFPRDFGTKLSTMIEPYSHCDPISSLREFKRKTQATASFTKDWLLFRSTDTNWCTRMPLCGDKHFVKLFNDLDVAEQTPEAVLLFAVALQKVVRCCDIKNPWAQLLEWRKRRGAELLLLKDNWVRIAQSDMPDEIVHLPCVIPHVLVDNFNKGTAEPFESFYSAEEMLKFVGLYYGTDKIEAFVNLFKDGKLPRGVVLP